MKAAKRKIIIPGGTGFLGVSLAGYLVGFGFEVVILSRGLKPNQNGIRYTQWDGKTLSTWANELDGAYAVINLAGRTVDCRYTQKNKNEIINSRVDSTKVIGEAIKRCINPPKIWLNASSATIYRDSRDKFMDETTGEVGDDFSMNVCKVWEKTFFDIDLPNIRKVALRTSIVLGSHGGALEPLVNLAKFGLGGVQGDGGQFFSWLHIDDFNQIIVWLLEQNQLSGVINCVGPQPVTNKKLMQLLRKAVGMSFGLSLKKWMLEIGAFFMQTETELVLKSRKVVPQRLLESGYEFSFDTLEDTINDLVARKKSHQPTKNKDKQLVLQN